ncbi:MAG: histidine kinase [Lentimicrobiaceae bacterium]|nr:histidine kinase [Lentimicrobiaceae bacterium]
MNNTNNKLRSKWWLHPLFLGVLIALPAFFLLFQSVSRYEVSTLLSQVTEGRRFMLHDMDGDGWTEKLILGYAHHTPDLYETENQNHATLNIIQIEDIAKQNINSRQFNWSMTWLAGADAMFGDYDNNGLQEIYLWGHRADSLFLIGIEGYGEQGLFLQRYIEKAHFRESSPDFTLEAAPLRDLNGDGFPDILFSLNTGYNIQPRGLFIYDIRHDSLIRTPSGYICYIGQPFASEWEGNIYIGSSTYTPGNHTDTSDGTLPDHVHYFTLYNAGLQPLFPYIPMGCEGNTLEVMPLFSTQDTLLLLNLSCPKQQINSLLAYRPDGHMLSTADLPEMTTFHLLPFGDPQSGKLALHDPSHGRVYSVDETLQLHPISEKLPPSFAHHISLDLDMDGNMEHLFRDDTRLEYLITDDRFRRQATYKLPQIERIVRFYPGATRGNGNITLLASAERLYYLQYRKNPWFLLRIPAFFLMYASAAGLFALLFHFRERNLSRQYEARQRMLQLEMLTLRNQIEPHFTFNVLNAISSLVHQGAEEDARRHIGEFSALLRNALQHSNQIAIPLQEELDFVTQYLQLQQMRYKDQFSSEVILAPGINMLMPVPRLCIHTFVENAIKHGLSAKPQGGKLQISLEVKGPILEIIVEDNGGGLTAGKHQDSTGKGLTIMNELFAIYYKLRGDVVTYAIADRNSIDPDATGTRITIRVPVS